MLPLKLGLLWLFDCNVFRSCTLEKISEPLHVKNTTALRREGEISDRQEDKIHAREEIVAF